MTTHEGRQILLRVEIWLARWWAEACADGNGADAEDFIRGFKTVRDLRLQGSTARFERTSSPGSLGCGKAMRE